MKSLFIASMLLFTSSLAGSTFEKTWQLNPTQSITFEAGKVSGFAGCNNFFGMYTLQGSNLGISGLASTRKACEKTIMQMETKFLSSLEKNRRFLISQDGMRLTLIGETILRLTSPKR
jgi:heat shock protein HslJ